VGRRLNPRICWLACKQEFAAIVVFSILGIGRIPDLQILQALFSWSVSETSNVGNKQCRRKLKLFIDIHFCIHTRMSSMLDQKQSHFEKMIIQTIIPQKAEISFHNGDSNRVHTVHRVRMCWDARQLSLGWRCCGEEGRVSTW
jgi:tRNA splicing ligase